MTSIDRTKFGHGTTADEVLQGMQLEGRLALVTGGSSGLGVETARALASRGARVVITARDLAKGEAVASAIRASTGATIDVEELELDSLESIRTFADRFLSKHKALHILVNNAGIMACPQQTTRDGFEMQFGTNHLGHFLLTNLLTPALVQGAPSRVVSLSSSGHRYSPVVFEDIHFKERPYDPWASYGQSKTANILFAVELDRRLRDSGVRSFSVHPGVIQTELGRHLPAEDIARFQAMIDSGEFVMKSVEAGAATSCYAATAPELEGQGGLYLEDCAIAERDDSADTARGLRSYAVDPESAARLWTDSEELVGQQFPVPEGGR